MTIRERMHSWRVVAAEKPLFCLNIIIVLKGVVLDALLWGLGIELGILPHLHRLDPPELAFPMLALIASVLLIGFWDAAERRREKAALRLERERADAQADDEIDRKAA